MIPREVASLQAPALRRRVAALIYESLLLLGIALAVAALSVGVLHLLPWPLPDTYRHAIIQAAEALALTGYCIGFWAGGRQTLAMKTWRLLLLDRDGRRLSPGRALLRALLSWLWVLPPLAVAGLFRLSPAEAAAATAVWVAAWALASRLRPDRQYWHDALAGTRLVDATSYADRLVGAD